MLTEKTLVQSKPSTKGIIFTATARTIIKCIMFTNNSAGSVSVTIWADSDGTDGNDENLIFAGYSFPTKISTVRNVFLVLEIGGTLTAEGTGGSITISGAELL